MSWPVAVELAGPTGPTGPVDSFSFSGTTGAILYSPDGASVTGSSKLVYKEVTEVTTTSPFLARLQKIAYGPTGGYVAIGYDDNYPPNTIYLRSPDGETWTGGTGPIQGQLYGVVFDSEDQVYVAVGADSDSPENIMYL